MRANHVGNAAMGIHVVRTILGVIFHYENERVVSVRAVGDFVHKQAQRIVVVRHLLGKGIHAVDSGTEAAKMFMHNAEKLKRGKVAVDDKLIKLPLPFLEAPEIWKFLVISA